jgi:homoserine kinase
MGDCIKSLESLEILVKAPASIANLGPGFDIASMAIDAFNDIVMVKACPGSGNLKVVSKDHKVPHNERNTAYAAAEALMNKYGINEYDIKVLINKGIPVSVGLGSSGASAAATVYALNKLFNLEASYSDLIYCAGLGEAIVSGEPHYDNVSASLIGGVVFLDPETMEIFRVDAPDVYISIVIPHIYVNSLKTKYARELLPKYVSLRKHVIQSAKLAKLILGAALKDPLLFGKGVSSDHIVEEKRSAMIPNYYEAKKSAIEAGALGFNISGAGPTVFAICSSHNTATKVSLTIREVFEKHGINAEYFIAKPSNTGAKVIEK